MYYVPTEILNKYFKIFENRHCEVDSDDYARFESNRKLLMRIAEVENSSLVVFDMARKNYTLLCSKFNFWPDYGFGNNAPITPEYFFQFMHPDDLTYVIDTVVKSFEYIDSLTPEEKVNYKLISDFRLINKLGNSVRFIQQTVVLELDKNGEIWLILKLIDLVPNSQLNDPPQRKLFHMKTGTLALFKDDEEVPLKNILSKREKEILGLMYQGLDSSEISKRLFISLNTVNNHRQHILSKTKTKNTAQALLYAKKLGII